jgi:hypothetical protein
MSASRHQRPELGSLNHETRGHPRRSNRKIGRSTQWIVGIVVITGITRTTSNRPHSRRRREHSGDLLIQRSGANFIALQDTIWKSVKLFQITRRCWCRQQRKNNVEENIIRSILTMKIRWMKST